MKLHLRSLHKPDWDVVSISAAVAGLFTMLLGVFTIPYATGAFAITSLLFGGSVGGVAAYAYDMHKANTENQA